jgi:hypothetical protein
MSRNRLRIVMLGWALLVIATIWIDHWNTTFVFSEVTCLIGVVLLIGTAAGAGPETKEPRRFGLLLLLVGAFLSLLQAIDRFVIGYR